MQIEGQIALVTGAASGLGEATARLLAQSGARVVILDKNQDGANAVAESINGFGIRCDISSAQSASTAMEMMQDSVGIPRIVVNCAGVAPASKIVGRKGAMALEAFAKVVEINLVGTFNILRLTAEMMLELEPLTDGECGVIVNTASIAAFEGQIGQAAYAASKAGVVGLTLPAAREFAQAGIRIMAIAPGIFSTPMVTAMAQGVQDSLAGQVPFPSRLGNPEEYAKVVESIVTNPYLNGETIRIDGAVRMGST